MTSSCTLGVSYDFQASSKHILHMDDFVEHLGLRGERTRYNDVWQVQEMELMGFWLSWSQSNCFLRLTSTCRLPISHKRDSTMTWSIEFFLLLIITIFTHGMSCRLHKISLMLPWWPHPPLARPSFLKYKFFTSLTALQKTVTGVQVVTASQVHLYIPIMLPWQPHPASSA